jgi:hypothetical protein
MIALLNETQAFYLRGVIVFSVFVALCIILIIAIERDYQEAEKKYLRQKELEKTRSQDALRKHKENEALGLMLLDQMEEIRHDFD